MAGRKQGVIFVKKRVVILSLGLLLSLAAAVVYADSSDIARHPSCRYCGMDRQMHAHSRVLIVYDNGTEVGTCSIHCAAIDLAINIDKSPATIYVGDLQSKKLIDSGKAFWVVGGSKAGVMTGRAKWAFETRSDANKFISDHGGATAAFDDAIKAAYEDMYTDTKMIQEKRKMKRMKMMENKQENKH